MFGKLKNLLRRNKLTERLMTNYGFRTIIFSVCSLMTGIAYAVFNLAVGLIYRSLWYGALACYYVMLDVIRGGVLVNRFKSSKRGEVSQRLYEIRQYLICGALLIVMTVFLAAMVLHIARQNKTFEYSLSVIYMTAGYTFYRIAVSVYNFVKSGKQSDFTVRALRCVNLVTALVSFLSLQSAALTAFSKNLNRSYMNALTGGIVCLLIVITGVFMIIRAGVRLKRERTASE